jgi:hypothetical protein
MINTTGSQTPIFIMFFVSASLFIINAAATVFSSPTSRPKVVPMTRPKDATFKSLLDIDENDFDNQPAGSTSRTKQYDDESSTIYLTSQLETDDSSTDEGEEDEDEDGISVPDLDLLAFPPAVPTIPVGTFTTARPKSDLMVLITNPSVMTFLVTMLLMGTALSMCNSFLLIFLSRDLKASSTVIGLTGPMSGLSELLFFFYSKEVSVARQ